MKIAKILLISTLVGGGIAVAAQGSSGGMAGSMMEGNMQQMMKMMQMMQNMDANKDGMLSKAEFMTSHEAMFDAMPKNKDGVVDMKDMAMCPMMSGMSGQHGR